MDCDDQLDHQFQKYPSLDGWWSIAISIYIYTYIHTLSWSSRSCGQETLGYDICGLNKELRSKSMQLTGLEQQPLGWLKTNGVAGTSWIPTKMNHWKIERYTTWQMRSVSTCDTEKNNQQKSSKRSTPIVSVGLWCCISILHVYGQFLTESWLRVLNNTDKSTLFKSTSFLISLLTSNSKKKHNHWSNKNS